MKTFASIFLVFAVFFGAFADKAGAAEQAPFTRAEFNRFMSDWPAYVKWAKKQGQKYENPQSLGSFRFGSELVSHLKGMGWKPERFFYVASQSARGLAAAEMRSQSPGISKQMEEARRGIMSNPQLTPEQKKQMLDSMGQSERAMSQIKSVKGIAPKEMALITANRNKLKRVFEAR